MTFLFALFWLGGWRLPAWCRPRPTAGPHITPACLLFQLRVGLRRAVPCLHYSCMEPSLPGMLALCMSKEGFHAILFSRHRSFPVCPDAGALPASRRLALGGGVDRTRYRASLQRR